MNLDKENQQSQKRKNYFTRDNRKNAFSQIQWVQLLLCVMIVVSYLLILAAGRLDRLENLSVDYFFRQRPAMDVHPSLVLIQIDEDSQHTIGRLPWPRSYYAEMVNLLTEWGASAIVFAFPLEQTTSRDDDLSLKDAVEKSQRVYLPVSLEAKRAKKIWVHSLPIVLEPKGEGKLWYHGSTDLEPMAKAMGHINVEPDSDGVVRRVRAFLANEDEIFPHIGLPVAFNYLGESLSNPYEVSIPYDPYGNLLINWAGKWNQTFPKYSYADLIRSYHALQNEMKPVITPDKIKDKICLIGITAKEFSELSTTPLETNFPVLGVHANVMNSVLMNRFIVPTSFTVNALCLIVIGMIASFLFVHLRSVASLIAGLSLGGVWAVLCYLFFRLGEIWILVVHPLILILTLFVFSAIFHQVINSRERLKLFDLATRDGLTGLYVIRHFREILNRVVREARKNKEPLCVVLLDVDNFKLINDTYGHPAGDLVLKRIAEIIFLCLRTKRKMDEADFMARYGGEEFIVLLRNVRLEDAALIAAERIRREVESAHFVWEEKTIPVTVSLGVSTLHDDELVPDAMVHRADRALYTAKKHGKNKVCIETQL